MSSELTRRGFLKLGLAAGAAVGASALSRTVFGQERSQEPDEGKVEKDQSKESKLPEAETEEPDSDDLFDEEDSTEEEEEEEETRVCPQCGALMYRQGRTWTCETCGYSYVE
ncbi:MAG: twin-arginine translocation signal domain-containing protein [Acidobacteriota bacterium]